MEFKEMSVDAQKALSTMCVAIMSDANSNKLLEMSAIFADCMIEMMALDKGITDYREYSDLIVTISHSIENSLRDYVEFYIDQEYVPDEEENEIVSDLVYMQRKQNLSSAYGMIKDAEDAD